MYNICIFLLHIATVSGSLLLALKIGRDALLTLTCIFAVLMNLLITKQIVLGRLTATATDAFMVGILIGLNLIQEYWGKEEAQWAIMLSFASTLTTTLFSLIHLLYLPAQTDIMHPHFAALFALSPRIVTASLISYILSTRCDTAVYAYLKIPSQSLRAFISGGTSQALDTVLFSLLGLYGVVPSIIPIIGISYSLKIITLLCMAPLLRIAQYVVPLKRPPRKTY